jgi:Phospholipase_D-nuclease N-terminal
MQGMTVLAVSTFVWVFILIPLLIVWAIGVIDIVRRRDLSTVQTVGWVIVVILFPFLGTAVYWFLRKPTEKEIEQAQEAAADLPAPWEGTHRRLPGE